MAEDGTTFDDESECVEYERNVKMQPVSKLHIEKLDGLVPLTDGMTCDGNEFYWYKVNDEDDFNALMHITKGKSMNLENIQIYYVWKLMNVI